MWEYFLSVRQLEILFVSMDLKYLWFLHGNWWQKWFHFFWVYAQKRFEWLGHVTGLFFLWSYSFSNICPSGLSSKLDICGFIKTRWSLRIISRSVISYSPVFDSGSDIPGWFSGFFIFFEELSMAPFFLLRVEKHKTWSHD